MNQNNAAPHWVAVDWCAGGMRAWAMDQNGAVLMKVRSAQGLAQVAAEAFEVVLFNLVRPWLIREQTPVIVSGLPGPVQQLAPASHRPAEAAVRPIATSDTRLDLHALPGLRAADGSKTALAHHGLIRGVIADKPGFSGAVCIPGSQTQWVQINAGEISEAQLFMTAELSSLLSPHGEEALATSEPEPDFAMFQRAVRDSFSQPQLTAQQLVAARFDQDPAKARLKGLLIGMELAGAREIWQGNPVMMVNASPWALLYEQALTGEGADVWPCDSDQVTLTGLKHAYQRLCETCA